VDRALVGVEVEAGGVERKADVVEHPAHLGFRILDQILIEAWRMAPGWTASKWRIRRR
jgi:hypothetical protein